MEVWLAPIFEPLKDKHNQRAKVSDTNEWNWEGGAQIDNILYSKMSLDFSLIFANVISVKPNSGD